MCYTAISSPRQSGVPCLLKTLSSLSVSSSEPQPKISISSSSSSSPSSSLSSLSSVFDSYSEAMPDSRNLAKSRQPRDLTSCDNSALGASSPLLSGVLDLNSSGGEGSRGGGGPWRKRKHSSLRRHWSLPMGLPRVPLDDENALLVGSDATRADRLTADTSGLGVVGSQITGGTVDRKVISNKLSWDPTARRREDEWLLRIPPPSNLLLDRGRRMTQKKKLKNQLPINQSALNVSRQGKNHQGRWQVQSSSSALPQQIKCSNITSLSFI